MAKFRGYKSRRSRFVGAAKVRYHKAKGSDLFGNLIAGAVVGVGVSFASPYIRRYVPSVAGIAPETLALLGGGVALKMLHKGGKFSNAMLTVGAAHAAAQLVNSYVGGNGSPAATGATVYANDL